MEGDLNSTYNAISQFNIKNIENAEEKINYSFSNSITIYVKCNNLYRNFESETEK